MAEFSQQQIDAIALNVQKWPRDKSIQRAGEELLELHLALLHLGRGKVSMNDVLEEMADVRIALKHLEIKFGDYQEQLDRKVIKGNQLMHI